MLESSQGTGGCGAMGKWGERKEQGRQGTELYSQGHTHTHRGKDQGRQSLPPRGSRRDIRERPGVRETFQSFPS